MPKITYKNLAEKFKIVIIPDSGCRPYKKGELLKTDNKIFEVVRGAKKLKNNTFTIWIKYLYEW